MLPLSLACAAPPDLTLGEAIPSDLDTTINLGATGMRGWVYYQKLDTSESRQIEVREVEAGSPADGIIQVSDLILGASGDGSSPTHFSADARKSLAAAIAAAEARTPATLRLIRWRSGTESTVDIPLRTLGAYSATAPYDCPKSAQILREGIDYHFQNETAGRYSFGTLALLAAQDATNPDSPLYLQRAQTEARALIPTAEKMAQMVSDQAELAHPTPWERGHVLIVLAEYYLKTQDAQVLPAIEAYAQNIARNTSYFGAVGNSFAGKNIDGSLNGPLNRGYGAVNSVGLPCYFGLLLAQECGISTPEITATIARSTRFFSYYAFRGAIPYGEHIPYEAGHESNGKSGLGALALAKVANKENEVKFFTQMAIASGYNERENGHTGSFFNFLWAPLGANTGGDAAAAAYFQEVSWLLDLNRKWDGSFAYDSYTENRAPNGEEYYDFRMSTALLLTYALPLRQLYITGRDRDNQTQLTADQIQAALDAGRYDAATRTTNQLVDDLGSWSPKAQDKAATELGTRIIDQTTIDTIESMALDQSGSARHGACRALGEIADTSKAATLVELLDDPENHVRYLAADAFRKYPQSARLEHRDIILSLLASQARPYEPVVEEDPLHFAFGELAKLVFYSGNAFGDKGIIPGDLDGVDRHLLYPAIRAVANNPLGFTRSTLSGVMDHLTEEDVDALADVIVDAARYQAPGDRMFGLGVQKKGVEILQKYNIAEGIPIAMEIGAAEENGWGGFRDSMLTHLKNYAGSTTLVQPDPDIEGFCQQVLNDYNNSIAQEILDAIAADSTPDTPRPLKTLSLVTATPDDFSLPSKSTAIKITASDLAQGDSQYTWRKISGPGEVFVTQTSPDIATDFTFIFDNQPGVYELEVVMSDSRALTEQSQRLSVTLRNPDGSLPTNQPPVANNQSLTTALNSPTPITLDVTDPEGELLNYTFTSSPSHGQLSGSAPHLVYLPDPGFSGSDSFSYEARDSASGVGSATVTITVSSSGGLAVGIYEPFDYSAGAIHGQSGSAEVGLIGSWTADPENFVTATSLSHGSLPTMGGKLSDTRAGGNRYGGTRAISEDALKNQGLLVDGRTLWFSLQLGYDTGGNTTNAALAVALATDTFNQGRTDYWINDDGDQLGEGIGVFLGRRDGQNGRVLAVEYRDLSAGDGLDGTVEGTKESGAQLYGTGESGLIVGKIVWGADQDTVEIYQPGTDLILPQSPISVLQADVDQSKFDTLTYRWGDRVMFDEVRFGGTYQSVISGTVPYSTDNDAPSVDPMTFYIPPTPTAGGTGITMTATPAYDINDVEYYFTATSGGGTDSGWQDSHVYTDTSISAGTVYGYTVKARDKSPAQNETAPSAEATATLPSLVTTPDVIGLTEHAAESYLAHLTLIKGAINYQFNTTVPTGYVLEQTPAAGSLLAQGASVALTVATGIESADYIDWRDLYPTADLSLPTADFDNDGLTNEYEWIWGLDPTDSSTVGPIVSFVPPKLVYQRRDPALTGKSATLMNSETMEESSWSTVANPYESVLATNSQQMQQVEVTLDPALLNKNKMFFRMVVE